MSSAVPLRIGIIVDVFDVRRGGLERYLGRVAQELSRRGHNVRVFCCRGQAPASEVRVDQVAVQGLLRGPRERQFVERATQLARDQGRLVWGVRHVLDVDLYQPHGGSWAASSAASLAKLSRWERPWRRRLRTFSSKHRYFQWADAEVFRRRPGLLTLAVSNLVREDLLQRYGGYRPRIEILWPPVDAAPEPCAPPAGASPQLLFVAHDFALKGLAPLLQALAVLCRSPNVAPELLVAGRGPVLPFRRLARRLGIASQVHFLGATEVDASFYARGNVLVHPTYHDPCALVCIEALFSGLPVVTTWANGAAPWVQQAGGQVVDDAEDVEALAAAIAAALSQRAPLPASSELYKQFSWSGHLQRLEQLLRELARERGMPC